MSKRLLLFLLVAVGVVAAAVNWQTEREQSGRFDVARPLMEGVDFKRLKSMHISSVERGADVGLRADSTGAWYLVDPVAYLAEQGLIDLIAQAVEGHMALSPPDPSAVLSQLGLDPPRVEWTLVEEIGEEQLVHRLLIGDPDPSGSRVYVLQDGELLLTTRALANTLNKDFEDFRSRRISEIDPAHVDEVYRSGSIQFSMDELPADLELSALRDGGAWRALRPHECALDPMDLSLLIVGASRLSFDQYVEEPDVNLDAYGLERPAMRIELRSSLGSREVLFIGQPEIGGAWFCAREGAPDIYRLSSRDAVILAYPFEAMIDRRLVRVIPDEVLAVRLEGAERSVRLVRDGEAWTVSESGGDPLPAEAFVVRELLAWISDAELEAFDRSALPGDGRLLDRRLILELEGRELGGSFGAELAPGEASMLRYRRFGEEVVGSLDATLLTWVDRPASAWWSLSLMELDELGVSELAFSLGEESLYFRRGVRGRWRDDRGREAVELLPWLDPLLFLRATERVDKESLDALAQTLGVKFTLNDGTERTFVLAAGDGLTTVCEIGPVRAVLLRDDLFAGLVSLFP